MHGLFLSRADGSPELALEESGLRGPDEHATKAVREFQAGNIMGLKAVSTR